jgi:hypothetical protein
MASSADVITMLGAKPDDRVLVKNVKKWFDQFKFMPPIPLQYSGAFTDVLWSNISFELLLELMLKSSASSFVLVIHGHEDGSGLYMPLAPHHAKTDLEHWDLQKIMDVDAGLSTMSAADTARMGFRTGRQGNFDHFQKIIDLMHQVRDKKIDTVEFRSCNLGKNIMSLGRFRQFFGAKTAGAPDLHTLFGNPDTRAGDWFLKRHMELHTGGGFWETYKFPLAIADPKLVACFQLNKDRKPEAAGHVIADSNATFDAWVRKYIAPSGITLGTNMPMHGLWIADIPVKPDHKGDPDHRPVYISVTREDLDSPLGTWGPDPEKPGVRRFMPPLSDDYRQHIVYSR